MLYPIVKFFVRAALRLYCRSITFNDPLLLKSEGPLLLASNHPNSFLDAVILGSQFKRSVHFLARGDAFRIPVVRKLLTRLQMIPIYRLSEGREYLALNDATFEKCRKILSEGGIVLIFAEGLCVHQWALRPLKKGAAKIALTAWSDPLITHLFRVLPVSINYNQFSQIGKRVLIHFGKPIVRQDLPEGISEGQKIQHINALLAEQLAAGMLHTAGGKTEERVVSMLLTNLPDYGAPSANVLSRIHEKQQNAVEKPLLVAAATRRAPGLIALETHEMILNSIGLILLAIPAAVGWVAHAPLYLPLKKFVYKKTVGTVFYDSVLFGILLLLYPLYWLIINILHFIFIPEFYGTCLLLLLPVFAWLYQVWSDCWQRLQNYFGLSAGQRQSIQQLFR